MGVLFKSRRGAVGPIQDTSSVLQLPGASQETPRQHPQQKHLPSVFLLLFPLSMSFQPTNSFLCQKPGLFFFTQTHCSKGKEKEFLGCTQPRLAFSYYAEYLFYKLCFNLCACLPIYLIQLSKYIVTLYSFIRRPMRNQFPGLSGILKNVPYCPTVSLIFPILSFLALLSSLSSPLLHSRQKTHKEKENMGISNNKY